MPVERRGLTEGMQSQKRGEPLGENAHYGNRRAYWSGRGNCARKRTAGQTLSAETEAGPKGQAGTTIPVLRLVSCSSASRVALLYSRSWSRGLARTNRKNRGAGGNHAC